jgi:hypothetical protein
MSSRSARGGRRAWVALVLGISILAGLGGCGAALLVPGSFAPQFDCASARMGPAPGGYRLEGCGQIAFFHCRWAASEQLRGERPRNAYSRMYPAVFWTPQRAPDGNGFAATREGVDQSTTPQECTFESQREMSEQEKAAELARLALSPAAERLRANAHASGAKVRAKTAFMGGQLEIVTAPVVGPDHLLLSVQGKQSLKLDDTCRITSTVEGTPLTVEAVRQTSPHELQLLIRSAELRGLENSSRFFGSVCGQRFDLDERARRTLAKYELAQR